MLSYAGALLETMDAALADHPNALIIGQGVDDFKGIFGSTTGLAEKYGAARVIDTPLTEEGMTGIAIGAALVGLYPINTHIRADFALLAMNQIINLAAKYRYMFGGLLRGPDDDPHDRRPQLGAGRAAFAEPAVAVRALSRPDRGHAGEPPGDPRHVPAIIDATRPGDEHRAPPALRPRLHGRRPTDKRVPRTSYARTRKGGDVTVVATSLMVLEALRAAQHVADTAGISAEIIDLNSLAIPTATRPESVRKTGRLVVADTSWQAYGVGAEVCRLIAMRDRACCAPPAMSAWRRRRARRPRPWRTSTTRASTRRWMPS